MLLIAKGCVTAGAVLHKVKVRPFQLILEYFPLGVLIIDPQISVVKVRFREFLVIDDIVQVPDGVVLVMKFRKLLLLKFWIVAWLWT